MSIMFVIQNLIDRSSTSRYFARRNLRCNEVVMKYSRRNSSRFKYFISFYLSRCPNKQCNRSVNFTSNAMTFHL